MGTTNSGHCEDVTIASKPTSFLIISLSVTEFCQVVDMRSKLSDRVCQCPNPVPTQNEVK